MKMVLKKKFFGLGTPLSHSPKTHRINKGSMLEYSAAYVSIHNTFKLSFG